MKTFLKKLTAIIFTAFFILPAFSFAQTGPQFVDVMFDEPLVVTLNPLGNHMVHTTLQLDGLTSYSGLSLILISSDDLDTDGEILSPYHNILITSTIQSSGTIPINVELLPTQAGFAYKFFVVDSTSLTAIGGVNNFDPDNSAPFQIFGASGAVAVGTIPPGGGPGPGPGPGSTATTTPGGLGPITFTSHIANPLNQDWDVLTFLQHLFKNIVRIAAPILVLFTVYAGFLFVEAQGNEEKLSKAKENLKYVIIGAAVVLGAWTIATVIKGTVDQLEAGLNIYKYFINLV